MFVQRYLVECTDQHNAGELAALFREADFVLSQKFSADRRTVDVDVPLSSVPAMRAQAEEQGFKVRIRLDSLPLV